jgi:DNA-directed RNA polymerase specialized sigma24 family protein
MTRKPPSPEAFDKLLAWLDPDREQAGQKYQKIHSRLIGIFSGHGCTEPEADADETIDRVIAKIDWLVANYEGDPIRYFCGVARNILREKWKHKLPDELPNQQRDEPDEADEQRHDCLDKCMAELLPRSRSLVLDYYEDQGKAKIVHRKKLAETTGITLTALRLRVFHIRSQLAKCMQECVNQGSER